MYYGFNTDSVTHARAALLLYALYKSRETNSSLNGVDTWTRFSAYIRGACIKSDTTAQFVQNFAKKAQVGSIKPRYLDIGEPVALSTGEMVSVGGVYDYRTEIIEDNSLLDVLDKEGAYLTLLVRERIQREKLEGVLYED